MCELSPPGRPHSRASRSSAQRGNDESSLSPRSSLRASVWSSPDRGDGCGRGGGVPRGGRRELRDFRIGERVIARRNDRHHDIDNGILGHITDADPGTGAITITTDTGKRRTLDADYVTQHLEHAYALTTHGAQGATFDWAAVIGRASPPEPDWRTIRSQRAVSRGLER